MQAGRGVSRMRGKENSTGRNSSGNAKARLSLGKTESEMPGSTTRHASGKEGDTHETRISLHA